MKRSLLLPICLGLFVLCVLIAGFYQLIKAGDIVDTMAVIILALLVISLFWFCRKRNITLATADTPFKKFLMILMLFSTIALAVCLMIVMGYSGIAG